MLCDVTMRCRRLKDFVGALQDYDEASLRHFEGVHVGRSALTTASDILQTYRSMRAAERFGQL